MRKRHTGFQQPFQRSVVEEGFPHPSISWTARQIQASPGSRADCVAEWLDTDFGTREQRLIDVPTHPIESHFEDYSTEELDYFNVRELGLKRLRRSRGEARRDALKPVPQTTLIRAVYLALADFCANPIDRIVPHSSADSRQESGTALHVEMSFLSVRVRRELEGWAIADGEITVRIANEFDKDGGVHFTHLPSGEKGSGRGCY